MSKKTISISIVIILIALFVVVGLFKRNEFEKHYITTSGMITDIVSAGSKNSGDYSVLYEFKVNGHTIQGSCNHYLCGSLTFDYLKGLLRNKSFPILYSTTASSQNVIVLTIKEATRFNFNIPDSIKKYDSIINCH